MLKRNKGVVFLSIGCILILIACGWYVYNIVEDKNAGQYASEILNEFDEAQNEKTDKNAPVINEFDEAQNEKTDKNAPVLTVDGDAFCGKVIIEKLSVELPVYDEWNYTRLKSAPCRYTGSVDTNDIIIAAHNYKSHFGSLNKLIIGDEVEFIDAYGKSHIYEVCEITTLDGTAVSDMQSGGWDFTLFTCTKGGEQRVTVRCKRK